MWSMKPTMRKYNKENKRTELTSGLRLLMSRTAFPGIPRPGMPSLLAAAAAADGSERGVSVPWTPGGEKKKSVPLH